MKSLLLTILSLLLLTPTAFAQDFVEEFRSEPGRRPSAEAWYRYGTAAARIDDLNGNGAPDLPFMLGQTLAVYDGHTREKIWELPNASRFEEIKWYGFFKYYDKGDLHVQVTHLVLASVTAGANPMDIRIIDAETGAIDWQMQNVSLMTVADLDGDDRPELLVGDRDNKQVVMVGWEDGGSTVQSARPPSAAWSAPASTDYDLTLKYESDPGLDLAVDSLVTTNLDDLDASGDGIPEIVMLREDDSGAPTSLVVRDGASRDVKWRFDFPDGPERDDLATGFRGFFDVNGDGQREALFGDRTAVTLDKTVHMLDANFEILAVHDLDGDGYDDLIGRGVQHETVQVWGLATPTNVDDGDLADAGFALHQNYPNPFNPATTIRYVLERPGVVELEMYDVQGRFVRTLVNEHRPAGTYTVQWDGRDAQGAPVASGTYFYRLRAGERQYTRQLTLIR